MGLNRYPSLNMEVAYAHGSRAARNMKFLKVASMGDEVQREQRCTTHQSLGACVPFDHLLL